MAVAGGAEGGVEAGGVLLRFGRFGDHGRDVAAAAEPGARGGDEAGVHVRRRHARAPQVGDQRDAGGEEARIGLGAGDLGAEFGRELAVHGGDVDAHLLEHAAAPQQAHHPAAALAGFRGTGPCRALEAARREGGVGAAGRLGLVLDRLEGGAEAVAQGLEPGAGRRGQGVVGRVGQGAVRVRSWCCSSARNGCGRGRDSAGLPGCEARTLYAAPRAGQRGDGQGGRTPFRRGGFSHRPGRRASPGDAGGAAGKQGRRIAWPKPWRSPTERPPDTAPPRTTAAVGRAPGLPEPDHRRLHGGRRGRDRRGRSSRR